jgi:hypothetical protein
MAGSFPGSKWGLVVLADYALGHRCLNTIVENRHKDALFLPFLLTNCLFFGILA